VQNDGYLNPSLCCFERKKEKKSEKKVKKCCTPTKIQNHQVFQQKLIILNLKRENNRSFALIMQIANYICINMSFG
jgi:Rad3-related DNA helicase